MSRFNFTKSRNPFLREKMLEKSANQYNSDATAIDGADQNTMTIKGTIDRTFILFGLMMITTFISYSIPNNLFLYVGIFGGLAVVLISVFRPHLSPVLAPIYALIEGLFVGTISAMFASAFEGIVLHAVTLTMSMLLLMLIVYRTGLIKVTAKFRAGVIMATGAVLILYLMTWVLSFFGIHVSMMHEGGLLGIGICLVIIGIAALNLLLDFDSIEKGAQYGAPKYMEWFSAMGLLITLVWLYIEFLRLLAILNRD